MVDGTSRARPPRCPKQGRPEQERQQQAQQGHEQGQGHILGRRQFLTTACGAIAGGLVLTGAARGARAQG